MGTKLKKIKTSSRKIKDNLFLFYFYVPVIYKEMVKQVCFEVGAGTLRYYQYCSFEYTGLGQFSAMEGSKPFIGKKLKLKKVKEVKVEMIVQKKLVSKLLKKFLQTHPYEEPAYGFIKILNFNK